MKNYQARNPSNARITIDYENKKNPVKFSYPNKKSEYKIILGCIRAIWWKTFFVIGMPLIFLFLIFFTNQLVVIDSPEVLSNSTTTININAGNSDLIGNLTLKLFLSYLIMAFFPPYLIAKILSKNEKFIAIMPKFSKFVMTFPSGNYYTKTIKKINSKEFKLEYFGNIFLDYEATGEFSKYLKEIKIYECDYDVVYVKGLFRKRRVERQDSLWKAKFIFKEIPKKGQLIINYL